MAVTALATGDVAETERLLDQATAVLRHAGPWFLNLPPGPRTLFEERLLRR
jgi:hypothetical protein